MELLAALIRRAHQSGTMVIGSSIDSREQAQQLQLAGIDYIESPTLAPPTAQFDFDFARWMADQRQAS
jgi:EAL domain-containing protein (putative c-di-GMP-specific phosphodiesterase class I)